MVIGKRKVQKQQQLTAEIETDGRCDFSQFVFRFNFVHACVCLDHVVEFEHDQELVGSDLLGRHRGPVVLGQLSVLAEPRNVRLRMAHQLALEDQPVAIIFLSKLRFLSETRRQVGGTHLCKSSTRPTPSARGALIRVQSKT